MRDDIEATFQSLSSVDMSALSTKVNPSLTRVAKTSRRDWPAVVEGMAARIAKGEASTSELNSTLFAMPRDLRATHGGRLTQYATQAGDSLSFDLIMDAYASESQADRCVEVFHKAQQIGIQATEYTYGILMKAFSNTHDLTRATELYNHMRDVGIEPNLVVSTSLIAAAVRADKVNLAFEVFDALKYRSTATAPDAHTYSLMIHACSKDSTKSAERAADLYQEMQERGVQPTVETYNALIRVYSARQGYYTEAWRLADVMQRESLQLDRYTWHALLAACVSARDLNRARRLIREQERMASEDEAWSFEATSFQLLMRAYATGKAKYDKTPIDGLVDVTGSALATEAGTIPWLDKADLTTSDVLIECQRVMFHLTNDSRHLIDSQLVDAYIGVFQSRDAKALLEAAVFGAAVDGQIQSSLYERLQLPKSDHTFLICMRAAYDWRDEPLLRKVWASWLEHQSASSAAFDMAAESLMGGEVRLSMEDNRFTEQEQEQEQEQGAPGSRLASRRRSRPGGKKRKNEMEMHRLYVECLARLGHLEEAVDYLYKMQLSAPSPSPAAAETDAADGRDGTVKGHSYAAIRAAGLAKEGKVLPEWDRIKCLRTRAVQLEDVESIAALRELYAHRFPPRETSTDRRKQYWIGPGGQAERARQKRRHEKKQKRRDTRRAVSYEEDS